MDAYTNIPTVAHVIQQALTPVFLLGGVGAILNVLTGRLARAIDRYRLVAAPDYAASANIEQELGWLVTRVRLIQWAVSLCTVCAVLVCASIVTLFLGAELGLNLSRVVSMLFILAILALTGGLGCFLREISLATGDISIGKV